MADRRPRVFISQPMRGRSEEDILAEREHALTEAKNLLGVEEVIEIPSYYPAFKNRNAVEALGNAITLLADADLVIFCKDWNLKRGCRIEYAICVEYRLNYIEI